MMKTTIHIILLCMVFMLSACRNDVEVFIPEEENVGTPMLPGGSPISGFYLLNEGNMGSNKASLDYYDYATAVYRRNVYGEANSTVAKEMGDVGNDLQVYGGRLYAVINCSNKVEVMDRGTARRIGQVDVPNCRYVCFDGAYAYVTSYAGPVSMDRGYRQLGYVAKIDTATLAVVDRCLVGYQPDGIAVANGRIYVANSGGYMEPDYETALSVIDVATFTEVGRIEVGANLGMVRADGRGQLWVSSRGNYLDVPARLHCIDLATERVVETLEISTGCFDIVGDSLYFIGADYDRDGVQRGSAYYGIVNTAERRLVSSCFIKDGTEQGIVLPYGIGVNPVTHEVLITDAKNYVNPGTLFCFDCEGRLQWSVRTGDIPAKICFVGSGVSVDSGGDDDAGDEWGGMSPYISRVYEYVPAPGQFVNMAPLWEEGDDAEAMRRKAEECIAGHRQQMISLGGWGGYVVFGFDHRVENVEGEYDLKILGNAFYATDERPLYGSAEPGIVMVSMDENGNGLPDDPWYELAGSEYGSELTRHDYVCTYRRPDATGEVPWADNYGETGYVRRVPAHTQGYYPGWIAADEITFRGARLRDNASELSGQGNYYGLYCFDRGYVDCHPNVSQFPDSEDDDLVHVSEFKIDWAVDEGGRPVRLPGIDFVRVYTGVNQHNGWLGEASTEVLDAWDLHLLDADGRKR